MLEEHLEWANASYYHSSEGTVNSNMHFLPSWPLSADMAFFCCHGHCPLSWFFFVVIAIFCRHAMILFFPTMPVHFSARASSMYTGSFELLNKIVRKAFSALIFPVYTADNPL